MLLGVSGRVRIPYSEVGQSTLTALSRLGSLYPRAEAEKLGRHVLSFTYDDRGMGGEYFKINTTHSVPMPCKYNTAHTNEKTPDVATSSKNPAIAYLS